MNNLRRAWLVPTMMALVGCGGQSTMDLATTPEESRATLTRSLEAWKGGISQKDLSTGSPALFFQDDTYRRGTPLTSYAFEGEGKVVGSGMSYIVNLTLKGSGEKENKVQRVAYRVVTRPSLAVTREEGIP